MKVFERINGGKLMRQMEFRSVLRTSFSISEDMLMNRIWDAFGNFEGKGLKFSTFVRSMSIFLRGTDDERIKFAFSIYESKDNGEGAITRDVMFMLLRNSELVLLSHCNRHHCCCE